MRSLLAILTSAMLLIQGCSSESSGGGGGLPQGMHYIKYEVSTGNQNTKIIYHDENGVDQEITDVDSHSKAWTYTFNAEDGTHLELAATLLGNGTDTVYVTIYVDHLAGYQEHSYGIGVTASRAYDIPISD